MLVHFLGVQCKLISCKPISAHIRAMRPYRSLKLGAQNMCFNLNQNIPIYLGLCIPFFFKFIYFSPLNRINRVVFLNSGKCSIIIMATSKERTIFSDDDMFFMEKVRITPPNYRGHPNYPLNHKTGHSLTPTRQTGRITPLDRIRRWFWST